MGKTLKLQVEIGLPEISMVAVSVKALCRHFQASEMASYQIALCVDEMLNNIAEHAFKGEKGHRVDVDLAFDENVLKTSIFYSGPPIPEREPQKMDFDPNDIANLPERGFGLYLIHQIMDQFKCEHQNGLTVITMQRKLED